MKILFFLIFCFELFAQNACIYQGADVLCLKSNLKFQTSLNRIVTGNAADPTVTATAGIPGDLYIRTTGQHYIKSDSGTTINWSPVFTGVPAGGGDVVGPAIATDNAFALYDGTTGKLIKNSTVTTTTITGMQTDITTLQTDLTTAETNITNLQTDMTTAQGDITTIQGDITTLQGSAITVPTCLAGEFNTSDGTNFVCATPAGGGAGDVVGPADSLDNEITKYDGVTGKLLKRSLGFTHINTGFANQASEVTIKSSAPGFSGMLSVLGSNDSGSLLQSNGNTSSIQFQGGGFTQANLQGASGQGTLTLGSSSTPSIGRIRFQSDTGNFSLSSKTTQTTYSIDIPISPPTAIGQVLGTSAGAGNTWDLGWITPAGGGGTGDVVGPGGTLDNSVAIFDGTTGKLIKEGTLSYQASEALNVGLDGGEVWINGDNTTGGKPHLNFTDIGIGGSTFRIAQGANAVPINLTLPTTQPANNQILQAQATGQLAWINTPAGGGVGDVVGPGGALNRSLAFYNSTTGKLLGAGSGITAEGGAVLNFGVPGTNGIIRFTDGNNGFPFDITMPDIAILSAQTWKLPRGLPTAGQVLSATTVTGGGNVANLGWVTPAVGGSGDVVGPGVATDLGIPTYSGTTGKLIAAQPGISYDATTSLAQLTLGTPTNKTGALNFLDSNGNNVEIRPTYGGTYSYSIALPPTAPAVNQVLSVLSNPGGTLWNLGWTTPAGGGAGDVVGPGVAIDNAPAVFSGTTGKLLKDSSGITYQGQGRASHTGNLAGILLNNPGNFLETQVWPGSIVFAEHNNDWIFTISNHLTPIEDVTLTLPPNKPLANQILQSDAAGQLSWINTPAAGGTGDVVGPASSAVNSIALFSDITGKVIKEMSTIKVTASPNPTQLSLGLSGTGYGSVRLNASPGTGAVALSPTPGSNVSYGLAFPSVAPAANQILQSNASGQLSWINTPTGGAGDVVGPGVSVDNRIAFFSGTTGKLIKDGSSVTTNGFGGLNMNGNWITNGNGGLFRSSLSLEEDTGSGDTMTIGMPSDIASSYILTLPVGPPANINQILEVFSTNGTDTWETRWVNTPTGGAAANSWKEAALDAGAGMQTYLLWDPPTAPGAIVSSNVFFNLGNDDAQAVPTSQNVSIQQTAGNSSLLLTNNNRNLVSIQASADSSFIDASSYHNNATQGGGQISSSFYNGVGTLTGKLQIRGPSNHVLDLKFPETAPTNGEGLVWTGTGFDWLPVGGGGAAPPTCTGSQRLTANGTTLTCVDNNYAVFPASAGDIDIDWSQNHVVYESTTANINVTFTNQVNGQVVILAIENTSAVDIVVTLPAARWAGGIVISIVRPTSTNVYTISRINGQNYATAIEEMK